MTSKRENKKCEVLIIASQQETQELKGFMEDRFPKRWKWMPYQEDMDLLKAVRLVKPDILFLEVSLQMKSTFSVLQKIRGFDKELLVCVCSSMHSQDLVSQLVLYGVDAYVSLPLRRFQIVQVLENFVQRVEEKRAREAKEKKQEELARKVNAVLEKEFVFSVLFGSRSEKLLRMYCDALEISDRGFIVTVEFGKTIFEQEGEERFLRKISDSISRSLSSVGKCVSGPKVMQRLVFYVGVEHKKWTGDKLQESLAVLRKEIEAELCSVTSVDLKLQIGGVYDIHKIYASYQEALYEYYGKTKEETENVALYRAKKYFNYREYANLIDSLVNSVKFEQEDSETIFLEILEKIRLIEKDSRINKIMQALILCSQVACGDGDNELDFFDCKSFIEEMEQVDDLETWAYQKFEYIVNAYQERHERNTSSTVKTAISYMEKNYNLEMSLDEVAKYVGISPQHFSKIFKQETGINYVDWLSEIRMEQAKKYLLDRKHTIKEICYLVGYKDPNYFSRIFKKMVGMPPSEFVRTQR